VTLARQEQTVAWELRGAWISRKPVILTLTERCMIRRLEGRVEYVAVTGAFVLIDGWHIPTVDILRVAKSSPDLLRAPLVAA
jgi:hypothetical protein